MHSWGTLAPPCLCRYNKQIRRCTMVHAMDHIISSPPAVFADVIHRHFDVKKEAVQAQIRKWAELELGEGSMVADRGGNLAQLIGQLVQGSSTQFEMELAGRVLLQIKDAAISTPCVRA